MKRIMIFIIIIISIAKVEALNVTLDSCIDGDTARFIVNNQSVKVRFLSINAPEIEGEDKKAEYMGEEAKNYTCELLTNAKNIKLEFDNNSDKKDKYDRLLAWIWIDDNLLQELLVKKGLVKVDYIYDEYLYVPYLCQIEKNAYNNKIGIWSKEKKLGYCSKVEDNNYTLEELKNSKLEDIEITNPRIFIVIVILFFILFIFLITIYILKKS